MILNEKQTYIMDLLLDMVEGEYENIEQDLQEIGRDLTDEEADFVAERVDAVRLIEMNAGLLAQVLSPIPIKGVDGKKVVSMLEYRLSRY